MPDIVGTLKPPRLAAAPSGPVVGQIYYDTAANKLYYWNGTVWVDTSGGTPSTDYHRYLGDWVAGSYLDGDIVVYQGYTYECVRPTSATPTPWAMSPGIGSGGIPTGGGCDWYAAVAPSGYLLCDGSAVSRATYASLFSVIGTTWGAGDGTTTFNLPDCRGRILVGLGTNADVAALAANDGAAVANRKVKHAHSNSLSFSGTAGNTGTESADHSHSGQTAGFSTNHTHGNTGGTNLGGAILSNGYGGDWGSTAYGSVGSVDHVHGTTWADRDHSHAFTSGGRSAAHSHAFTPAGTIGGTVGASGGTADTPAYVVVNRIIKT